ncbi:tRNA (adenosine(37)-N6)-dimethylallyltransferase MiaA [Paracrocinitomix mangrovi]|uniref:tRNA (adenosine(37)-N6)-dimethylallyltransferase MiaA n=1 Tax=Paracrocinitomix mangrovi TaxID=2862509 RepID=UPI001C8D2A3A|nr:tRNA (adenosine(37)-N6)-dimethylallyltransferase MiaA [Paracrocinitomix mangrovi]UKN02209.1 tRNA (adenosine(37)-N6)-dimethylallyltransferase MiaA [Paracrocinitomix mangrovi]
MAELNQQKSKTLIVIVGPTAVGKTAMSIKIAQHLNCPIISTDSRQFYKEMEIGTAKPDKSELEAVKHYFINSRSIKDYYTAGMYEADAIQTLDEIFKENDYCVAVGGSGLYINGLCYGIDDIPSDQQIRKELFDRWQKEGLEVLSQEVKQIDPEFYNESDMKNPRRVMRALEVYQITGEKYSNLRQQKPKERGFETIWIGLEMDLERLYERINQRVDQMIESGLENEVRELLPYSTCKAFKTVGYQEFEPYFEGEYDLEKTIELVKRNSRRFAKKQYTWFRKNEDVNWFNHDDTSSIIDFIDLNKSK